MPLSVGALGSGLNAAVAFGIAVFDLVRIYHTTCYENNGGGY